MKMKNNNMGTVAIRSKFGGNFSTLKKSTGDLFTQMSGFIKKDKQNKDCSMLLKKKKMVYTYLKA